MGLGMFENRLVASAKVMSMEKYGYCSSEDLAVVKDFLSDEVCCEKLEGNKYKITRAGISFEVEVRGHVSGQESYERKWAVEPSKERKGKWVSVFDPANH
ncbi:hypothetical protein K8R43_05295 [archaeon]|nr:hypothetical protein [archaeon]